VHFVKKSGRPQAKVFKLKSLALLPGAAVHVRKTISLAVHTTRRPHPGRHHVGVVVNGRERPVGYFDVS
jgi:hypothetical protein